LNLQALRYGLTHIGIAPIAVSHQEEPPERKPDFAVDRLDAVHQDVHGCALRRGQALARLAERPRNETDLALRQILVIMHVQRPAGEYARRRVVSLDVV